MSVVVVGTTAYGPTLQEHLAEENQSLRKQGLQVDLATWESGRDTFFACNRTNGPDSAEEVFRFHIAAAVANTIHSGIEATWVHKQLRKGERLDKEDQERTAAHALEVLRSTDWDGVGSPRQQIACEILTFLSEHPSLHVEGFFRFRLSRYRAQIAAAISESRQWLKAQKEHEEFIELLRYFVHTQEPQLDQLDVIVKRTGLFKLVDEHSNTIENNYLEGFVIDLVEGELDYGDLLMSTLISLAPRLIRCHFEAHLPVIETLKGVFEERICFCEGCEVCQFHSSGKQKSTVPPGPAHW